LELNTVRRDLTPTSQYGPLWEKSAFFELLVELLNSIITDMFDKMKNPDWQFLSWIKAVVVQD